MEVNCQNCGCTFSAREADRRRGWARFCSKSCKAKAQEKRTGQYSRLKQSDFPSPNDYIGGSFEEAMKC